MKVKTYISRNDRLGFLNSLVQVIAESQKDVDITIVLDSEEAEIIGEMFEESNLNIADNGFGNDFGELTGVCLVTVIKEGNVADVIIEDYCYQDEAGIVLVKHHEADKLLVLDTLVDTETLVKQYEPNELILVANEKENEKISSLLFE